MIDVAINLVPICQLIRSPMGKRKVRYETLTKINPSALKAKPPAISQYAALNGTRVTTVINPVRQPPVPAVDSPGFDLNPTNVDEEHTEFEGEDDISKTYYVTRVCKFSPAAMR